MTAKRYMRTMALLGLFAMFMAFAGPLASRIQALDEASLASFIDLQALHCGDGASADGQPAWVAGLAQCGYCDLLAHNPPLPPDYSLSLPAPSSVVHLFFPPRQQLTLAPPTSRHSRAPPAFHA